MIPAREYPSFAGKDPAGSPPIPNGSVWEKNGIWMYLVQYIRDDKWMLLNFVYEPYHTTGQGGSKFIPPLSAVSQEFLQSFIKEHGLRRLDIHFEPVLARRDMRLLRQQLSQPCEVCFHNAWVPVKPTDEDALAVTVFTPNLNNIISHVRCDHCWLRKQYHQLRKEKDKLAAQEIDADPPRKLVRGNVIRDKVTGHKRVVLAPMNLKLYQEFICEQPHQDGDFSYLCQKDYCRCKQ